MRKGRGPLKATVSLSGPYPPGTPEAWAYQKGQCVTVIANVMWKGDLITVRVTIPRAVPEPPR